MSGDMAVWPQVICPEDGQPLSSAPGEVVCAHDHHWCIESRSPRMIAVGDNYADAFGLHWKAYRRTQLDSHTKTTISLDRARRCIGEEAWAMLHRRDRTDVLEVGCPAGRFTEVLLATGAYVTSVDLSSAVDANAANFPATERHRSTG